MEIEAEGPDAAAMATETELRCAEVEVSERKNGVCVSSENAIFLLGERSVDKGVGCFYSFSLSQERGLRKWVGFGSSQSIGTGSGFR